MRLITKFKTPAKVIDCMVRNLWLLKIIKEMKDGLITLHAGNFLIYTYCIAALGFVPGVRLKQDSR